MTTPKTIAAEYQRATAAEAALDKRITALEHPVVVPPPVVKTLSPAATVTDFQNALVDMSYDVLELPNGFAYHWREAAVAGDRSTRPLTVRVAPGGHGTFFGDKGTGGGPFYFGQGGKSASDITFDFTGVTIDGWTIGDTGLVWVGNAKRCHVNGPTVQNITVVNNPINSWALYCSIDGGVSPSDCSFDNWHVKGNPSWFKGDTRTKRAISAAQVGHSGSVMTNIALRHWIVESANIALYASTAGSGLTVDDWLITDFVRDDRPSTVYFQNGLTGTFSNMRSDLGNLEQQGGMTRGPGNVGI